MQPLNHPTTQPSNYFAFTLGREWKLSLAELFAIWGDEAYINHTESVAIFRIIGFSDEQIQKKFLTIGGSIRVIKIIGETDEKRFAIDVIHAIENSKTRKLENSKTTFALGAYGCEYRLSDIGLRIKKTLQEKGLSVRLVNQENKNINAASFKKERLAKTGMEYSIIIMKDHGTLANISANQGSHATMIQGSNDPITPALTSNPTLSYLGITLACQDIDAYAARDTGKSRDMAVGMMPPKLVQMMINLGLNSPPHRGSQRGYLESTLPHLPYEGRNTRVIYDPFCGLGTTLIEAVNMGITSVFGSDLSALMVQASTENLGTFVENERLWQERIRKVGGTPNKDLTHFISDIWELDARDISQGLSHISKHSNTPRLQDSNILIVSEGYLGEIMNPRDITLDKVKSERRKLESLYDAFFAGLKKSNYTGTLVMSFPFWSLQESYVYFTEIYSVIEKHGFKSISLLPGEMGLNTRQGSLLYRREGQTVGREIIRITKSA